MSPAPFFEYADWPLLALAAGLSGLFALVALVALTWRSLKWRSRPSLPELLSLPLAVAAAAAVQLLVELLPGEGFPSVIGASAATGASVGAADYGVRRRSLRMARSILVEVTGDVERDVRQAALRMRGALEAQSQEIDVPNLSPALR